MNHKQDHANLPMKIIKVERITI